MTPDDVNPAPQRVLTDDELDTALVAMRDAAAPTPTPLNEIRETVFSRLHGAESSPLSAVPTPARTLPPTVTRRRRPVLVAILAAAVVIAGTATAALWPNLGSTTSGPTDGSAGVAAVDRNGDPGRTTRPAGVPDGIYTAETLLGHEPVADAPITMTFNGNALMISAGCNGMSGTYAVTDRRLRLSSGLDTTQLACESAAETEEWLSRFAGSSPKLNVEGDSLELANDDGSEGMTLRRTGGDVAVPLEGTRWLLEQVYNANGEDVPVDGSTAAFTIGAGVITHEFACGSRSSDVLDLDFNTMTLAPTAIPAGCSDSPDAGVDLLTRGLVGALDYHLSGSSLSMMTTAGMLQFEADPSASAPTVVAEPPAEVEPTYGYPMTTYSMGLRTSGRDGTELLAVYGGGACDGDAQLITRETLGFVDVSIRIPGEGSKACSAVGISHTVRATLKSPLGDRMIRMNSNVVQVFDGERILSPSYLPEGVHATAEGGGNASITPVEPPADTTSWYLSFGDTVGDGECPVSHGQITISAGPPAPVLQWVKIRDETVRGVTAEVWRADPENIPGASAAIVWEENGLQYRVQSSRGCGGDQPLEWTDLLQVARSLQPMF